MPMEKQKILIISIIVLVTAAIGLTQTFFILGETEQAVVVQMGKPVKVITSPGLRIKKPFIQQVVRFDKRLLEYNPETNEQISTRDKKNLVIDNYCQWKIVDPLKFLESVGTEIQAQSRLYDIIYAELRAQVGLHDLADVISNERETIMKKVTRVAGEKAHSYGIEILDIRIKKASLPSENEKQTFDRMKEEKEMEAKSYRLEGEEEALKIRSQTDKEKKVILADAYKKAQEIKGEGEAGAMKIYADAYNRDPDFYSFMRTLDAYRKSLQENTIFLFSEDNEFFGYLKETHGKQKPIRKGK
jgi:membrane protease subunit HflC